RPGEIQQLVKVVVDPASQGRESRSVLGPQLTDAAAGIVAMGSGSHHAHAPFGCRGDEWRRRSTAARWPMKFASNFIRSGSTGGIAAHAYPFAATTAGTPFRLTFATVSRSPSS